MKSKLLYKLLFQWFLSFEWEETVRTRLVVVGHASVLLSRRSLE